MIVQYLTRTIIVSRVVSVLLQTSHEWIHWGNFSILNKFSYFEQRYVEFKLSYYCLGCSYKRETIILYTGFLLRTIIEEIFFVSSKVHKVFKTLQGTWILFLVHCYLDALLSSFVTTWKGGKIIKYILLYISYNQTLLQAVVWSNYRFLYYFYSFVCCILYKNNIYFRWNIYNLICVFLNKSSNRRSLCRIYTLFITITSASMPL